MRKFLVAMVVASLLLVAQGTPASADHFRAHFIAQNRPITILTLSPVGSTGCEMRFQHGNYAGVAYAKLAVVPGTCAFGTRVRVVYSNNGVLTNAPWAYYAPWNPKAWAQSTGPLYMPIVGSVLQHCVSTGTRTTCSDEYRYAAV